jgi:predicted AAA+ superfamily ATPase
MNERKRAGSRAIELVDAPLPMWAAFGTSRGFCALRFADLLNKADLAGDFGIAPSTANQWLSVLQASGQVVLLESWFSNRTKSIVKSPKLYLADVGLLCALLNIRSEEAHIARSGSSVHFASNSSGRPPASTTKSTSRVKNVSESLAGRADLVELETRSFAAIRAALPKAELASAIVRGGFPELYANTDYGQSGLRTELNRHVTRKRRRSRLAHTEQFPFPNRFRALPVTELCRPGSEFELA